MSPYPPTDPFSEIPIAPPSKHNSARKPGNERQSSLHPPFSRQHLPPQKTSPASTFFAILGLGAIIYLVCGYLVAPILIKSVGTRTLAHYFDRSVTIGHVEFNPITLSLTLVNGIIGPRLSDPTDKVDPIISFSTLTLNLDARSLPRRAIICQELSISQPFLHLVHNQEYGYNISSLLQSSTQANTSKELLATWISAFFAPRYSINNITISKGEIHFDDLPTAKVHHLTELNFRLPTIANINYQNGQVKPHFSAIVNGTPIRMSGQVQMEEGQKTTSLSLKMNNLDLAAYKDYLSPRLGILTLSGQADLDLNLLYAAALSQAEKFRLVGTMTLRTAKLSSEQGEFSVDSGFVKGGFFPATSLFQAEKINLHHPVWQRNSGQASLFDFLRLQETSGDTDLDKSWPNKIAAILLANPKQGPTLPINHLQITNGEIRELSENNTTPVNVWQAIDVSINTAQLTGGQDGQQQALFTLNAKKQTGSRVSLQGSASTAPFEAKGLLVVSHIDITTVQDLWQRFGAALPVKSGVIDQVQANFNITIDPDQRPRFLLDPLSIQAKNLRIEHNGQLLEIPVWQSEQGLFASSDPTLHLGRVQLQQPTFTCRRQSSTADWQSILSAPVVQGQPTSPVDLNGLELTNASLLVENQGPPDISLRLERLDLQVDHFDPQKENIISAAAMLDDRYPIQANGTFLMTPFSATLNIQASDLPLSTFQPIFDRYFVSQIHGILSAEGILNLPSLDYRGKWSIDSLRAPFISCQSLSAQDTFLTLRPLALKIDRLNLKEPSLKVTANHNGRPQLPAIMKPGWQPASSAQDATVTIKGMDIDDGTVIYDLPAHPADPSSVSPRALMTLSGKKVTGSIEDFIVVQNQAIPFTFAGLLEDSAEFQAQGVIRPFASNPGLELKSRISGLPIIALGPLLEPYWGFTVKTGTLDFESQLTYEDTLIQDSSHLSLHGLSLGKPLTPQAIKAIGDTWQSLPLVQAMLQDSTNTIKLTVPIDGRTDTGFTYQTAMKAFLNQLLLKAMVSPMNLLSYSQKAPSDIVLFQPGDSQLEAAALDQLEDLASLLQDRPLLVIRLAGFADRTTDSRGLLITKEMVLPQAATKGHGPTTEKDLLNLANKRVQAVQKTLTDHGISPKQIRVSEPELINTDNAGKSGCRVAISFSSPR